MRQKTTRYYDEHHETLAERYDGAQMAQLHAIFERYIPQSARVLDIGFGSGRDLLYLKERGAHVTGADASGSFVRRLKTRHPELAERLFHAALPELELPFELEHSFDAIVCIAVWMHLRGEEHAEAIRSLRRYLKPEGVVILSYSIGEREADDPRFFERIDPEVLTKRFEAKGFEAVEERTSSDGMARAMTWRMQVFQSRG